MAWVAAVLVHVVLLVVLLWVFQRPEPEPPRVVPAAYVEPWAEPADETPLEVDTPDPLFETPPEPSLATENVADVLESTLPEDVLPPLTRTTPPLGALDLPERVAVWALEARVSRGAPPSPDGPPPAETLPPPRSTPRDVAPTPPPPRPRPPAARPGAQSLQVLAAPDPLHYYPLLARRQGIEGEVIVHIVVASTGVVTEAQVARSSGHVLLDDAALRVAFATRFVPGPSGAAELPVRFRLQ